MLQARHIRIKEDRNKLRHNIRGKKNIQGNDRETNFGDGEERIKFYVKIPYGAFPYILGLNSEQRNKCRISQLLTTSMNTFN
jgi:hypothetical protein